jgi:hypothetical protein
LSTLMPTCAASQKRRPWDCLRDHGLRFWDAAHVGINVDKPERLVEGIRIALADDVPQQLAREDALQLVYQPRTNGAAYAVTAISDWLASRLEVAA